MITWNQWGFQDGASPVMEEIIFFHDFTLIILRIILRGVGVILLGSLGNKRLQSGLLSGHLLEAVWTFFPALILLQIVVPSLLLLYALEESHGRALSLKAAGHQWYWTYEYSDFWLNDKSLELEAYIKPTARPHSLRLLEVDNRVVLPIGTQTRTLVTSADVLHAWAVPALGVKADACPGRLNQVHFLANRPGVFYGQCSEICGANHRFIPIGVEVVNTPAFLRWVRANLE